MINRWYIFAVLACWGAAMGWLFVEKILPTLQQGDPPEYAEVLPAEDDGPRRTCWEIHYKDRSIGQATSWAVRNEDGSGKLESVVQFERLPVSEIISELLGTFGVLMKPLWKADEKIEIGMDVTSEMHVGADDKLDSFVTELRIDDLDHLIRVEGEVNGNKLDLAVLTSEDGTSMHVRYRDQVDLSSEAVVSGALSPQDRLADLHVGQMWTIPVYRPFPPNSPLQMVQAKVERKELFAWNNESVPVYQVVYRADAGSGISISREPIGKMWVGEEGAVLQQEARIANMEFRFVRLPDDACQAPEEDGQSDDLEIKREKVDVPNLAKRMGGDDWPQFLGPTRDSKSTEKGILTDWPADGPRIVWKRTIGTSYGIGSVSRGRYFQFDRHGDNARLSCLNAETGELLWKWEYPTQYEDHYGYNNGPRCSPVVDGDRVYIYGAEGMLHCLRVTDGEMLWKVDTAKQFGVVQNFFGVGSTPVIEGDLLICMVGGSPEESRRLGTQLDRVIGNGSGIVAFDKHTGEVKYKLTDELASYAAPQLATIDGRRWCFMFARGGLVGFDPAKGKVDFEYPWRATVLESVNASTPVVVGDEVFISETYGPGSSLLRVKPGESEVVWQDGKRRDKAMQTHWNTAVYHDGYLYGSSGRHASNADLRCIDWKTGEVQWTKEGLTRSSLMYVDGHFVCLSEDGTLRLIKANPKEYDVVASAVLVNKAAPRDAFTGRRPQLLKPPCWAAPILSHGLLYVRGDDKLVCLELIPQS